MGFPATYSHISCEKQHYAYINHKVICQDLSHLIPFEFCGHSVEQVSLLDKKMITPGYRRNGITCLHYPSGCVRSELKLSSADSTFHVLTIHGNPYVMEYGSYHTLPLVKKLQVRRKEVNLDLKSFKLIHVNSKKDQGSNLRACHYITSTTSDNIWPQHSKNIKSKSSQRKF